MRALIILLPAVLMAQTTPPATKAPASTAPATKAPAKSTTGAGTTPATKAPATATKAPAKAPAAPPKPAGPPPLTTDEQKEVYALGLSMARQLNQFDLSPEELEIVKRAIQLKSSKCAIVRKIGPIAIAAIIIFGRNRSPANKMSVGQRI